MSQHDRTSRRVLVIGVVTGLLAALILALTWYLRTQPPAWATALPPPSAEAGEAFLARHAQLNAAALEGDPTAVGDLARLYHIHGYADVAADLYASARTLLPDDPALRWLEYRLEAQWLDAMAAQNRLHELLPLLDNYLPAMREYAELVAATGTPAEARAAWSQVLQAHPGQPHALLGWARAAAAQGDTEAAMQALAQCVEAHPRFSAAWFALARLHEDAGRPRIAEFLSQQAQETRAFTEPTDPWRDAMVDLLTDPYQLQIEAAKAIEASRPRRALELLTAALALAPEDATLYRDLALARQDLGDLAGSIEAFREALRLDPDNIEAARALAIIYARQDNRDGLAWIEEQRGEDAEAAAVATGYRLRGREQFQQRRLDAAISALARARQLEPEHPQTLYLLALAHLYADQPERARAYVRELATLPDEDGRVRESLIDFALKSGDDERVEALLTAHREAHPERQSQLEDHLSLASNLAARGHFAKALIELRYADAVDPDNDRVDRLRAAIRDRVDAAPPGSVGKS